MSGTRPYRLAVYMQGRWRQTSYSYRKHRDETARAFARNGLDVRKWDVLRLRTFA